MILPSQAIKAVRPLLHKCKKCGALKPRDLEHFYKHTASKDGFTPRCKTCVNEDNKLQHQKRLAANPDRVRALANARSKKSYRKDLDRSRKRARLFKRAELRDPVRRAAVNLRKRVGAVGLSNEQYHEMLAEQGNRCAICLTDSPPGEWNIDHDHKTGKVRGILCSPCNRGLGAYRDNPESHRRAALYLEKNS